MTPQWYETKSIQRRLKQRRRQAWAVWAFEVSCCLILGAILGYLYGQGF